IRLWPPARTLASSWCSPSRPTASASVAGASYAKSGSFTDAPHPPRPQRSLETDSKPATLTPPGLRNLPRQHNLRRATRKSGTERRTAARMSAQASPQVAAADGEHRDPDYAPDERIGQPGLDAGTGVGARQAADPQGDARRPVRRDGAVVVNGQEREGDYPGHRGHEGGGEGGRGDLGRLAARGDQDGGQDRAAPDSVDSPGAADGDGQRNQDGGRQQPPASTTARPGRPGEREPQAKRQQHHRDHQVRSE